MLPETMMVCAGFEEANHSVTAVGMRDIETATATIAPAMINNAIFVRVATIVDIIYAPTAALFDLGQQIAKKVARNYTLSGVRARQSYFSNNHREPASAGFLLLFGVQKRRPFVILEDTLERPVVAETGT
jgi:hypothetical protein